MTPRSGKNTTPEIIGNRSFDRGPFIRGCPKPGRSLGSEPGNRDHDTEALAMKPKRGRELCRTDHRANLPDHF